MNEKKIKILTISDHPYCPSGVGTVTKLVVESCLESGKFSFVSLAGAVKHQSYEIQKTDKWGDDLVIIPVDGYGTKEQVRSVLRNYKLDIVWIITDPRQFYWLWEMEHEIRKHVPLIYYHVWDHTNPPPLYNKPYYESNDKIVTISKVTEDAVEKTAPNVEREYLPHVVDTNIFKKLPDDIVRDFRQKSFSQSNKKDNSNKMIFFWNNRNARRKQSGTLIFWFKEFLDIVGHDNAVLMMHTDCLDPNGQNLYAITEYLGLQNGQVLFSQQKVPQETLALVYNMADCVVNISDAEGFGLTIEEALACETPVIVNMTGGLQEQVTDGKDFFGIGIQPAATAVIGSIEIPYINEDRIAKKDFIDACLKMYNMSKDERDELGRKGRQHLMKNYNFENHKKQWIRILNELHEKHGSWETRKNYQSWELREL